MVLFIVSALIAVVSLGVGIYLVVDFIKIEELGLALRLKK